MVKSNQILHKEKLPRIEELRLKNIWPIYREDFEFNLYIPDIDSDKFPPRDFFYSILSAVYPEQFDSFLLQVK